MSPGCKYLKNLDTTSSSEVASGFSDEDADSSPPEPQACPPGGSGGAGFALGGGDIFDLLAFAFTQTGEVENPACPSGDCAFGVPHTLPVYGNIGILGLLFGLPGGDSLQRIKDIINNALKQAKLSECLNKWIGPGTVLTNANLPYINATQSSAQLSARRGANDVLGTPDMPVPSTGRGTALVASDILGNTDLAMRTYLHETANILAMQQFTNSGVTGNDRALLGARGTPPTGVQAWEAAHPPADGDIGWQFELCVFGARGGTTVVVH